MKKNIGTIDKILRVRLAITFGILFFMGIIPGILGIVLMVLAAVFLLTSLVGTCPLYLPFGFSTKNKHSNS